MNCFAKKIGRRFQCAEVKTSATALVTIGLFKVCGRGICVWKSLERTFNVKCSTTKKAKLMDECGDDHLPLFCFPFLFLVVCPQQSCRHAACLQRSPMRFVFKWSLWKVGNKNMLGWLSHIVQRVDIDWFMMQSKSLFVQSYKCRDTAAVLWSCDETACCWH